MQTTTPLGRFGTAPDLAGAALFLASRAGAWVTGATLVMDGGVLVYRPKAADAIKAHASKL